MSIPAPDSAEVAQVARWLDDAESLLFITGAGLSADSGLPTYRGVGGLYDGADTEEGVPIEVALSGRMFRSRPEVSWRHIAAIEQACRGAAPNLGHRVIAALELSHPRVWVLTQNVDGLHQAAGSTRVIPIHGDVHGLVCTSCGHQERVEDYSGLDIPPLCRLCGGLRRPEVVLFGEMLPDAAVRTLERELTLGFDLVVSVGTSSLFPYITEPMRMAWHQGVPTVEINPQATEASRYARVKLRSGAADTLGAILEASGRARPLR